MLQNYLKIALRFMLRQKGFSVINLAGLTIGITCTLLIVLFIRDERRIAGERLEERARSFATAPAYRHREPPPRQAPTRPAGGDLTAIQRRFAEELRRVER